MKLKGKKKFEDWLNLKPVTDEEFEELLNERPRRSEDRRRRKTRMKKAKKEHLYPEDFI
jgi:hypothetical protein